jgi:hypothetical protein
MTQDFQSFVQSCNRARAWVPARPASSPSREASLLAPWRKRTQKQRGINVLGCSSLHGDAPQHALHVRPIRRIEYLILPRLPNGSVPAVAPGRQ